MKEKDEGKRKKWEGETRVKRGKRRKKTSKILMWDLNLVHQCLNNLNWSEIGGRFMCRTVWAEPYPFL